MRLFLKTLSPRLRTIIFVSLTLTLYVLVRIDTKYVEVFHAQLLNKRNPLSGDYEIFLALFFGDRHARKIEKTFNCVHYLAGSSKIGGKRLMTLSAGKERIERKTTSVVRR